MADPASKKLPGWLLMLAGIAIMAYTKFIVGKQPGSKIGWFIWIGLLIVVLGLLREISTRITKKKPAKELVGPPPQQAEAQSTQAHPASHQFQNVSPHQTHSHVAPQQHPSHPYQPPHKQCPRCHGLVPGHARFCHSCGHQFY